MLTALYVALALAAAAVLFELLARAWMARFGAYFVHKPRLGQEFHLAEEVLPSLPPLVRFSSNADGERGDEVPRDPTAVHRVLVAGGSAAEGYLLDQDATWSMALQRRLDEGRSLGRRAHVGNVARSLMPCREIAGLMEVALPRFRSLDTIVLMVGASDLVDWFEAETPPVIEERELAIKNYCDEHPEGPFTWTVKGSATYRVLRRLRSMFPEHAPVRKNVGASLAKHREMRANAKTMIDVAPDPAPMLDAFERHLRSLIVVCKSHAPHVIVARQPWLERDFTDEERARIWNFGQGSPYRGVVDTYYALPVVWDLMSRVSDVAARAAAATGAEALDLKGVVPDDFDHYYDTLHFTPLGAEKVAAAVAARIEARAEANVEAQVRGGAPGAISRTECPEPAAGRPTS